MEKRSDPPNTLRVRIPNLTNALVAAGVTVLAVTLFAPGWTAERAARVETRAEESCRALLQVAIDSEPFALDDAGAGPRVETAVREACSTIGHPSSYLLTLRDRPEALANVDCLLFASKHYCFMLTRRPSETRVDAPPAARQPFEVYGWPLTLTPPGHTAFFVPEYGQASFTRNLMHQYVGWEEDARRSRKIPRPGSGVRRRNGPGRDYRGRDDERWIVFLPPS